MIGSLRARALLLLDEHGPLTATELAGALSIHEASARRLLAEMSRTEGSVRTAGVRVGATSPALQWEVAR